MKFRSAVRLAGVLLPLCALVAAARAADAPDPARYRMILSREPFGPAPADPAAAGAGGASSETGPGDEAGGAPPPPSPLRLRSLSRYDGRPAAGFEEVDSGRSFLLREGESMGAYRLVQADLDVGAAVFAQGTNEFFVTLAYAAGQPTNMVPSARAPFLTAFRPDAPAGPAASDGAGEPDAGPAVASDAPNEAAPSGRGDAQSDTIEITPEEDAELRRKATVRDPDGTEHLSYREYNRLRVRLREEKAAELRERSLARWRAQEEERAARARAEAAERAEAETAARAAEAERRAAVVQALAMGYDVEVDFELTEEEAALLRDAGYEVPGMEEETAR